jgi:membrane protein DedA with SNARE-associated domain
MEDVLEFVRSNTSAWTLVLLFVAAAIEYMLPPLPADSVVLAGSLWVVTGVWSFETVFIVAVAGGVLGALSHFMLGRWLSTPEGGVRGQRFIEKMTGKGNFEKFVDRLRRYGYVVIAVNRALPGIRSVTFIAAGAIRLPFAKTMFFGLISNVAWTLVLLLVGTTLGGNYKKIEAVFSVYSRVLAVIAVIIVASFVIYKVAKRKRAGATT